MCQQLNDCQTPMLALSTIKGKVNSSMTYERHLNKPPKISMDGKHLGLMKMNHLWKTEM